MKSLKDFNYLLSLDRRYTKTESEIFRYNTKHPFFMPVNSEIFRIYRHLFYGSPLKRRRILLDLTKNLSTKGISYLSEMNLISRFAVLADTKIARSIE